MARASSARTNAILVITCGGILLLVAFGYYLWTGTKVYGPVGGNETGARAPETLRPSLKVDGNNDGSLVQAHFSLTNIGNVPIRVLDTLALEPLFTVSVDYRADANGRYQPVFPTSQQLNQIRNAAVMSKAYDPERDVIVPLSPGRSLSVPIRISNMFDVRKHGQYEITLSYQPEAVGAAMPKGEFDDLNVYRKPFKSIKVNFDMPFTPVPDLRKTTAPPTTAPLPKHVAPMPPSARKPGSSGVGEQNVFD